MISILICPPWLIRLEHAYSNNPCNRVEISLTSRRCESLSRSQRPGPALSFFSFQPAEIHRDVQNLFARSVSEKIVVGTVDGNGSRCRLVAQVPRGRRLPRSDRCPKTFLRACRMAGSQKRPQPASKEVKYRENGMGLKVQT